MSAEPAGVDDLTGVRGAVYVPARAFNAYQAWRDYDPAAVERDLGFATRLNLDAVRAFLSYEYWLESPGGHERALVHFLGAAAERDLGVVPVCFESAGRPPTPGTLADDDPRTAAAVRSPAHAVIRDLPVPGSLRGPHGLARTLLDVVRDRSRWAAPGRFVEHVVGRYGDHPGVLAVEVMNEPGGWPPRERFARAMLRRAADLAVDVPLTMGCKRPANNRLFVDAGLDVLQFHCNCPPTAADLADRLAEARAVAAELGLPAWLTEWQRTREEPPDVLLPNYASLAGPIRESGADGDFLWSLMLKPAYLPAQRRRGRLNGIFHEDGAVFSAADARAVAGDPDLGVEERRAWPGWVGDLPSVLDAPEPGGPGRSRRADGE